MTNFKLPRFRSLLSLSLFGLVLASPLFSAFAEMTPKERQENRQERREDRKDNRKDRREDRKENREERREDRKDRREDRREDRKD